MDGQDVISSMGNNIQEVELSNGVSRKWKYARVYATYQLLAMTLQFPMSLMDLKELVHKKLCEQLKKVSMQAEQFIREVTKTAEDKNLKEAFLNDKTQGGGSDSVRINMMGQLPTPNWKKRTEFKKMTENLDEFKNGTFPRKIKECVDWPRRKECVPHAVVTPVSKLVQMEGCPMTNGPR